MINLFQKSLTFQGFPIEQAQQKLLQIHQLNTHEIIKRNEQASWAIFRHHFQYNSVYRQFVKNGFFRKDDWQSIPVLTKKDLQQPLSCRLSEGFTAKNVHLHNTSGSSGTPFYFAKDKYCHAMSWAINIHRFGQFGVEFGNSLQARFYGIPLGGIKYYKELIKDKIAKRKRFPVFDLSDEKLEQIFHSFKNNPYYYVNGYTSSLVLFARFLIDKGVTAKAVCPNLQVVFTTSEVCSQLDRKILEEGFGVRVVNEYGAAELDLIAFEDKDGDWLLNYESLFVEILDEKNHAVPPGEEGRVIVTALYNKAMPFIRYELGDTAILSRNRKGNYQVLEKVTGRTNDIALLPSGKKSPGLTFYYISKSLLEQGSIVKEFIIKQLALDHFHYEYVAERSLNTFEKEQIKKAMDKYLEPGLKATFEQKKVIKRTKAGKLKHFQNLISLD
ncbi:phenylacetate--CoA ligase family protein [Flexithrix dorotheae]|uniref:phenylacetate--CoA ligase family protein n=1 Tax=Flexithrix dorotheae TaxID=70993 RepID=UPI000382C340|nr:phenylacetate--CoA ligase family protein [Flexithrix dorotheae]